jgi:hypothetical protein
MILVPTFIFHNQLSTNIVSVIRHQIWLQIRYIPFKPSHSHHHIKSISNPKHFNNLRSYSLHHPMPFHPKLVYTIHITNSPWITKFWSKWHISILLIANGCMLKCLQHWLSVAVLKYNPWYMYIDTTPNDCQTKYQVDWSNSFLNIAVKNCSHLLAIILDFVKIQNRQTSSLWGSKGPWQKSEVDNQFGPK